MQISLIQLKYFCIFKLEYLAVYGRAFMAAFRQLSTHIVPPRSNTHGQKFDPECVQQIIILDPPLHWTFWSILV